VSRAVTRKAHRWRTVPPAFDRWRAVRSTLTFGLCLGAVTAVAGLHYGVFAAIGCYVDAYGTRDPYPRRGPGLGLLCAGFVVTFTANLSGPPRSRAGREALARRCSRVRWSRETSGR
jgi:hypothetical protein